MICIFCALQSEIAPLAAALGLSQSSRRLLHHSGVIALYEGSDRYFGMVGGMGQRQSVASLEAVVRSRPCDEILIVGSAGSLNPSVSLCTILWINSISHIGKPTLSIDMPLSALEHHSWNSGSLVTVNQPVSTIAERNRLYQQTNADAVDMESYAIVEWAQAHSIPCNAVRIISDMANHPLEQILQQIKQVMPIIATSLASVLIN